MGNQNNDPFFSVKRPWSRIKDRVLSAYLAVYLPKVATLGKRIVLVDGFAGPGRFEDGSAGSPLLIVNAAEARVPGKYLALFVNKDREHHEALTKLMQPYIDKGSVQTIYGSAADLLANLAGAVRDQTLFLYLDPFGLAGCEFNALMPFLQRTTGSTEIFINIQRQEIPRLACVTAEAKGLTPQVDALQRRLSAVMGNSYWRGVFADSTVTKTDERVTKVVEDYRRRIAKFLPYTGSCPVKDREDGPIKYQMMLCSRHPHALEVMNDAACRAYNQQMYEQRVKGTLFEPTNWEEERDLTHLTPAVIETLARVGPTSRRRLWLEFVQQHFMEFMSKEYRQAVVQLIGDGVIDWDDVKGTGRLNDDATLFLKDAPPAARMDRMVPRVSMVKKPRMKESVRQVS
jgi:three-Cys-motif partner protein